MTSGSKLNKTESLPSKDRSGDDDGVRGGWGTIELWKCAEKQQRGLPLEGDDAKGKEEVASTVGLPASIADVRLRLARGKAAVLVCLFQNQEGAIRVILTKRAQALSLHSGEVALPGGKRDKEDVDDVATALREAKEEIGLDPSLVKILTTLEPFVSKQLTRVIPVIALLIERNKFKPFLNPSEVDTIFDVPLDMFLKDEQHRVEESQWLGFSYQIHYFDVEVDNQKFMIWGLTAAILIRCASFIYQRPAAFNGSHSGPGSFDARPRL